MLKLILGHAGTGKTTYLYEQIAKATAQGKKCILLVPEQASFESEKQLYRKLGPQLSLLTEALSFTRLCDLIFRQYGGLAGIHLDDTGKLLLMSTALTEVEPTLRTYGKNASSAAFAAVMCETVSELKNAGVSAARLREVAAKSEQSALADKLFDIYIIYDAFRAMIARGYDDTDDHLLRACKLLDGSDFFADYAVFIDGFMAFMGTEWLLLERIIASYCETTIALPCVGLHETQKMNELTSASYTARRLVEAARRSGAKIAAPVVLRETPRYQNPALEWIALEYPSLCPEPFAEKPTGVCFSACGDFYDEMEVVAAQIGELVRSGYRYREIAVIARSLERYLAPLQTVFGRYDIPFFTDLRMDIEVHPLVNTILCALEAVRGGFDTDQLLLLSKSMISGLDELAAGELENYCFVWNVQGNEWKSDFVNNPDGMTEGMTPAQQQTLDRVNQARRQMITPLVHLQKSLRDCDGESFARSIFEYLEKTDASSKLMQATEQMPEEQQKAFLETSAQVWDALMGLLDIFGGAQASVPMPLARFVDLFRMGVSSIRLGALPQTIDQVLVGTADRIRPHAPRAVFVIGLNEGEFPLWNTAGGILTMSEREELRAKEIDLLRTPEQQSLFEKYYVYFALTQASERLYLSFPQRDTAGSTLSASSVVSRIQRLFPAGLERAATDPLARIQNEKTAFEQMAQSWQKPTVTHAALQNYFAAREPARLAELERIAFGEQYALVTGEGRRLFAGDQRLSPSRIERYQICPFSYFCQIGLKLKSRRKAEFNPMESGSLIHYVMEQMLKCHGGEGISRMTASELREQVEALVREHLLARIANLQAMPERFQYLFRRLVGQLVRLLERLSLELAQSAFVPVGFELPVGMGSDLPPLTLQTPEGTVITVEGVIDRVDEMVKNGKRYIRVVDYKSGQKEFRLSDICHGLNLQMLIYLFAVCNQPSGTAENQPAGVLYMPARDRVVSVERDAGEEQAEKQRMKLWKMSGLLLDDITALTGMEQELAGVYIPVKQNKDGSIDMNRSSVATAAQMGVIRRSIEETIIRMTQDLQAGEVAACPIEGASDRSPCDWCDYRAICGHEQEDHCRPFVKLDKAAAIRELEGASDAR